MIAIAAVWMAYAAFNGAPGRHPLSNNSTNFRAIWPETSIVEAHHAQARVDEGDPSVQWRTKAVSVAFRFAQVVLGWSHPIAGVTTTNDPDTVIVSLHGPDASCHAQACSSPSPQTIVTLTLRQLVRSGEGGIWSITSSDPPEPMLALPKVPICPPVSLPISRTPSFKLDIVMGLGSKAAFTASCYYAPADTRLSVTFSNELVPLDKGPGASVGISIYRTQADAITISTEEQSVSVLGNNAIFRGDRVQAPGTVTYSVPPLPAGTYYIQSDQLAAHLAATLVVQ
ncbi:MAG: hypothetical protein M3O94_02625 [Actinomycetota bacterium]|nr:hypothetical protein [Actinomycetota bacterium]